MTTIQDWTGRIETLEAVAGEASRIEGRSDGADGATPVLEALAILALAAAEELEGCPDLERLAGLYCYRQGIKQAHLALRARAVRASALGLLGSPPQADATHVLAVGPLWPCIVAGMRTMLAELRAKNGAASTE